MRLERTSSPTSLDGLGLIVDCDPGVDDAIALAIAVGSRERELLGVTTVCGNVSLPQTTRNALALLDAFGRHDVPIAAGAARGLVRQKAKHAEIHGANGLGDATIPDARRARSEEHAVNVIAKLLADRPAHSVTLAAIGPLTNVALLAALYPAETARLEEIVVMGTTSSTGNITPYAEYNTWADPEAAQRVLSTCDVPIRLVELEATRRATLTASQLAALRDGSPGGALLATMLDGYHDETDGPKALHDALALAAIVDPAVLTYASVRVAVDTSTTARRGATTFTTDDAGDTTLRASTDVDVERFRHLVLERVAVGAG